MQSIIRIFLIVIAFVSVWALAYTAYTLNSRTLKLPFIWSESQRGDVLELVFTPPSFLTPTVDTEFIDKEAILSSIERDGKLLDRAVVSSEYSIEVQGGYMRLASYQAKKDGSPLTIKSSQYNKIHTTSYRLPRNITLTPSDIPKSLTVDSNGLPKDQLYDVSFYGLAEGLTPSDVRYYVHYDTNADCSISNWQTYQSLQNSYYWLKYPTPTVSWEPILRTDRVSYSQLIPKEILPDGKDGQKWIKRVQLPYDVEAPRVCIIAWVGWLYQVVEDRFTDAFTATGSLSEALSPEFDMNSQIEFTFSHDIYADTGTLYSAEYMQHRSNQKIDFLKRFDITPNITLNEDNLMLTPDRAVLTLPLHEGKEYNVSLRDISDIYGRSSSVNMRITPVSEPFLSLRLNEKKQIFPQNETIDAKLYALKAEKPSYNLKLCKLSLEDYSQVERMITNVSRGKNSLAFDVLARGRECRTKEIILSASGYVSPFTWDEFFQGTKTPGLYMLYFANPTDIASYQKFIQPIIFSVVDTHLTLKVDASGKMLVHAVDIATGKPRENQVVNLTRNISRTHKERWDGVNQRVEKEYIPLTSQAFATGVSIGTTNREGFAEAKIETLMWIDGYDTNPFGLMYQSWWDYEGRYDSFLVESRGDGHLGYLVSTWNDGITGYNFGIKDSDYSYQSRGRYAGYIHTDRKLYLPGEKVHIHAIIRENKAALTIPSATSFIAILNDPLGREIRRVSVKTNEFGSFSLDYELPKEAALWMYSVNLTTTDALDYIENAWTNFQVEVFKNPTFTATVELKSDDLEDGAVKNLMKIPNKDPYSPWYESVYTGNFTIWGIVQAKYYNGAEIKNTSYTYRVYRSEYYPDDYWGDCFWWCYWEPPLELYTEGTGSIDADGYGVIRIPVEFRSSYSDYTYSVEVTIRDPLSWEEVTTPGSLVVKLPVAYKGFSLDNPLTFTPKKKILKSTEMLTGDFTPTYGKWDASIMNKYRYEIYRREYDEWWVEDIRMGKTRITTTEDILVSSGTVTKKDLLLYIPGGKAGEYHMKVIPIAPDVPESTITESIFYIGGETTMNRDMNLRVIPERTVYHKGEMARVMIQVPFTGSYLLITQEKGWVITKEYLYLSGNTLMREYKVDDSMMPNSYIWVVALRPSTGRDEGRTYAVGYGEIVTDISEKKSLITITPDKKVYKNKETANIDLTLTDNSGNPLVGEVTVMVVDESLIRLLWNIDLDIIPKFYQKYPFTVRTALTAIGIERGQFLSRKWSNGGSGDKGWDGVEISTRSLFQNTAYYHPGVVTDLSWKARVSFTLPDNITDYRIIALANTKVSHFGVGEKTIEIRKDYVLEPKLPLILRNGDTLTATVTAFNATKRITSAEVVFTIGTGSGKIEKKSPISLDVNERKKVDFQFSVPNNWKGSVPYSFQLKEKDKILDGVSATIKVAPIPVLTEILRDVRVYSGANFSYTLPVSTLSEIDKVLSRVNVTVASSYASEWKTGLDSLVTYPYGCIEQTIASTLPNRIALSLTGVVSWDFDVEKARSNLANGLAKILRMQHFTGGWTYWEWDASVEPNITPYVVRTLFLMRNLWEKIPEEVFTNALNYILANEGEYQKNMDTYAEAVWTLALLKNENALAWWKNIDTSKLSRHGYIAYITAAQKLGTYTLKDEKAFIDLLEKGSTNSWYWSKRTDTALFIQLLFERKDREKALKYLDPLMRFANLDSYYVSTQEKIQTLLALLEESRSTDKLKGNETIALRGDTVISDISLRPDKPSNSIETSQEKIGESYTLKRNAGGTPLIVTTRIQDVPKDLTKLPAYSTGGIKITRTFDLIDESKGVDTNSTFVSVSPVKDATFKRWKLYRVTLTAQFASQGEDYWYNLAIEDFLPSAWRPINQKFQTESSLLENARDESWWNYTEAKDDRLLAHMSYGWGNTRTYSYYFRPLILGEFILPPATAYFMYDPEVHAYTEFSRVTVTD